jgi:hypothetical protein
MALAKNNKSAVIRHFQAKGIDSPVVISREAKKLGVTISPGYVSLIKHAQNQKRKKEIERAKLEAKAKAKGKKKTSKGR